VSGPIGANLAQSMAKGWYWITLSFASAIIAPCLVSSAFSRNNDRGERILAALFVCFCFAWDWSNAASNNAATSDTQHTTAENERTAKDNVTAARNRLNDAYDAQVAIARYDSVAKLEADKKMATDKSNAAWETYTQNASRKATRRYARMPPAKLRDDITAIDIKIAAAKERDRIDGERKGLQDIAALPSQADATIDTFKRAFAWLGFAFQDKTVARIISWWNGGFMQTMGLLGPHFAFIYLFKTLSPEASECRRLERARDKAAKKAAKEAARAEVKKHAREEKEAEVKARFVNPEPVPAPVQEEAEAQPEKPPVCDDPDLAVFIPLWLQPTKDIRTSSKAIFEEVWVPWCETRGIPPGKQTGFTKRMNKTGLYKSFRSGGETWFADVSIRAKSAHPHLRVVT